ncbi:hypothetical protein OIDMADRAFT_32669 [Oidiodendron maius Zn]|uniref:Uncharacterized protein n=1 Tax=Oidiodendron maius (strain Zn) TaxID=913774 RepID=A0A0C3H2K0_OIDMZ|nr:hypothetical protein OIDMADRAFT_32669 [Oidiodendron maius Zn]
MRSLATHATTAFSRGCTARLRAQPGRVLALCRPSNTTFGTSVDEVGLGDNADRPLACSVTLQDTLDDALVLDIIICLDHCYLRDHPTKLGYFLLKNLSSEQLDQGIALSERMRQRPTTSFPCHGRSTGSIQSASASPAEGIPTELAYMHTERGLLKLGREIIALVAETGTERPIIARVRMFACNWAGMKFKVMLNLIRKTQIL